MGRVVESVVICLSLSTLRLYSIPISFWILSFQLYKVYYEKGTVDRLHLTIKNVIMITDIKSNSFTHL